jgi:hypothetical protein
MPKRASVTPLRILSVIDRKCQNDSLTPTYGFCFPAVTAFDLKVLNGSTLVVKRLSILDAAKRPVWGILAVPDHLNPGC